LRSKIFFVVLCGLSTATDRTQSAGLNSMNVISYHRRENAQQRQKYYFLPTYDRDIIINRIIIIIVIITMGTQIKSICLVTLDVRVVSRFVLYTQPVVVRVSFSFPLLTRITITTERALCHNRPRNREPRIQNNKNTCLNSETFLNTILTVLNKLFLFADFIIDVDISKQKSNTF